MYLQNEEEIFFAVANEMSFILINKKTPEAHNNISPTIINLKVLIGGQIFRKVNVRMHKQQDLDFKALVISGQFHVSTFFKLDICTVDSKQEFKRKE